MLRQFVFILKLIKNSFNKENVHDQWRYRVLVSILLVWTIIGPDYFWKYLNIQELLIVLLIESSKQQIFMMTVIE